MLAPSIISDVPCDRAYLIKHLKEHALFFVAWGLWLVILVVKDTFAFPHDSQGIAEKIITHAPFLPLVIYEIQKTERYGGRDALFLSVLMIFFASGFISTEMLMLKVGIFVYCARRIDYRLILIFTLCELPILCGIVIAGAALGLIEMGVAGLGTSRVRYCLGFEWANRPLDYLLSITMMYLACFGKKVNPLVISCILVVAFTLFSITDARTPFALLIVLLASYLFISHFKFSIDKPICRLVIKILFLVLPITMVGLCLFYSSDIDWMRMLNGALSSRLEQSQRAFLVRGIGLFGSESVQGTEDFKLYLDSAFLQLLINHGIVLFLIVLIIMLHVLDRACKSNDRILVMCLLLFSIWGNIEEAFVHIQLDPFLFLIGSVVFSGFKKAKIPSFVLLSRNDLLSCDSDSNTNWLFRQRNDYQN